MSTKISSVRAWFLSILCLLLLAPVSGQSQGYAGYEVDPALFQALEWRNIGPFRGGRVTAVAGHPEQQFTYYMGATGGGVWKTKNGGISWENISDGFFNTGTIGAISVAESDRNVIYVGTGESPIRGVSTSHGDGVYKSTDAGETWQHMGLTATRQISKITIHPSNPDIIHVAVEVGGFLRTTDGGKTWTTTDNINPDAHRVFIPSNDPNKLYGTAPTTNCGPEVTAGFCVSSDGGASWKSITPRDFRIGYVDPFFVHPKDPNLLFVAGARTGPGTWRKLHTADARVARSRDGGKTWDVLSGGLPDHIRANIEGMAMDAWSGGYALFAGTTDGDIFYSEDEGEHWTTIIKGIGPVSKSHHHVNLSLEGEAAHH